MSLPPVMDVNIDTEENRQLLEAIQQGGHPDLYQLPEQLPPQVRNVIENEIGSNDGADSGIDLKHEVPNSPIKGLNQFSSSPNVKTTFRGTGYKPKSPCFHQDPNYTRWIASRQSNENQRVMRMATVSARHRMYNRRPSSLLSYGYAKMPPKLLTWHDAMESRPPLRIDMSGPTATTYSPRNKPLYETNAPAFSFGKKETEKEGSGQKAWSKLWFRSNSPFTHKTNFELRWPTAPSYEQKSTLGPRQICRPEFPSHSIGIRHNLEMVPKFKEGIPASNQYEPELASKHIMRRSPAFSMACKLPNKIWVKSLNSPAPDMYNPRLATRNIKPSHPAFTMCVERRFKRHDIGPFATL